MNRIFDGSFDHTFQKSLLTPGPKPVQSGCRREGIHLTWLTLQGGWMYWVFEGFYTVGAPVISLGERKRGGLKQDIQRESGQSLIVRTAGLTEELAFAVASIRESISVHWLQYAEDGTITQVPVTLPTGDADVWNSRNYTNGFSTQIFTPGTRSQRI